MTRKLFFFFFCTFAPNFHPYSACTLATAFTASYSDQCTFKKSSASRTEHLGTFLYFRLVKGQYKIIIGTAHQCLRTTALISGVIFRKNSITFYVERDWGKKLQRRIIEAVGQRNKILKVVWSKVTLTFNLLIFCSQFWRSGRCCTLTLSHPPCLQCGCLPPPHLLALVLSSLL